MPKAPDLHVRQDEFHSCNGPGRATPSAECAYTSTKCMPGPGGSHGRRETRPNRELIARYVHRLPVAGSRAVPGRLAGRARTAIAGMRRGTSTLVSMPANVERP